MSQNTSGLSNQKQAALMAIVIVLSSAGTFTALEGEVTNTQWKEAIGIAAVIAGVAAAGIKEYLGALGSPVPTPTLTDDNLRSALDRLGVQHK